MKRTWTRGSSGPAGLLLVLLVLGSCGGLDVRELEARPGPYDQLDPVARAQLQQARARYESGQLSAARAELEVLARLQPEALAVAILLQEVELASASSDQERRVLRATYEARALAQPSAVSWILAARLVADPAQRLDYIGRALNADPQCVWGWYARAHTLAQQAQLGECRSALARAFELDPGHLPARRLEAQLEARTGNPELAQVLLERWISDTEGDPRFAQLERIEAQFDLALLFARQGRGSAAEAALDTALNMGLQADGRAEALRAALLEEAGEPKQALRAAQLAQIQSPSEVLPLVQQALLYDFWLRQPEAARLAWQRVLQFLESEAVVGLGNIALSLQARARLEALEAQVRAQEMDLRLPGGAGEQP